MEEKAIVHFEMLWKEARDEIKRRIEQRDKYSIQLSIALTALVAISFAPTVSVAPKGLGTVLIAAPLVSIYFTFLILYSYRVHSVIAKYLREELEPEMARLSGTSINKEWETYYKTCETPGIRRQFFLWALWAITALSLLYLWLTQLKELGLITLIFATIVYGVVEIVITRHFRKN
ncbi:MAG: hypothetical protein ABIH70_09285 [Chloroflexota bacterium]